MEETSLKSLLKSQLSTLFLTSTVQRGAERAFENLEFGDLFFEWNEVYEEPANFQRCKFNNIDIEGSNFKKGISFENCEFSGYFLILNAHINVLTFENCHFNSNITIYSVYGATLSFDNCTCDSPIRILGGTLEEFFYQSKDEKTLLKISGNFTEIKRCILHSSIGMNFSISDAIINTFEIRGDFNSASRINITSIRNNIMFLDSVNNDGRFYFTKITPSEVLTLDFPSLESLSKSIEDASMLKAVNYLSKFHAINSFPDLYHSVMISQDIKDYLYFHYFQKIAIQDFSTSNHTLRIQNCSMGVFEIKNTKLQYYKLIIMSSDLSGIKLIKSKFPVVKNNWTFDDGLSFYNDLYTSASKQNNSQDKIDYYVAAQYFAYQRLKGDSNSFSKLGNMITLLTSRCISNHGSNWLQAVFVTFAFGLISFILFIVSLENYHLDCSQIGINYFFTNVLSFLPQFLNPLHKIDFIDGGLLGLWSGWVDLLSRIIIGVGLFETVRSFRKYVRS
ncbi:MAG: hypothetical protein EOO50_13305 [Flavobacterium sp.]|uniref:hypothetical protein n=1 Tax=Flavobacterium sp. TaxID=239 RepID=UPI0011FFBCB8|nr:hypothetical protein [Flavobacterium sp.]RZJ65621.1 MAG: hypothetical protein EOO50_13305 [Flavobacterium sp.]